MKETIETRTIVEIDLEEEKPILESCVVLEHMRDAAKDNNFKVLCNDTLNALCRFTALTKKGFLVSNQNELDDQDLVNKVIKSIKVTGYDILLNTTDGLTFNYSATDGGYSSWTVEREQKKKGESK